MSTSKTHPQRIRVAPTQDPFFGVRYGEPHDPTVNRRARLRIDEVSNGFPLDGADPDFAFVHLLQKPTIGQPVVWASRGTNYLTLYDATMFGGGIAFVVTGFVYDNRRS
ncbi:MAG: hypothetical protein O3A46_01945 [Candidatus Poribacteria bacterium]|nr:hypothetical protein [Candidatus Poribacteria bacterium]